MWKIWSFYFCCFFYILIMYICKSCRSKSSFIKKKIMLCQWFSKIMHLLYIMLTCGQGFIQCCTGKLYMKLLSCAIFWIISLPDSGLYGKTLPYEVFFNKKKNVFWCWYLELLTKTQDGGSHWYNPVHFWTPKILSKRRKTIFILVSVLMQFTPAWHWCSSSK